MAAKVIWPNFMAKDQTAQKSGADFLFLILEALPLGLWHMYVITFLNSKEPMPRGHSKRIYFVPLVGHFVLNLGGLLRLMRSEAPSYSCDLKPRQRIWVSGSFSLVIMTQMLALKMWVEKWVRFGKGTLKILTPRQHALNNTPPHFPDLIIFKDDVQIFNTHD